MVRGTIARMSTPAIVVLAVVFLSVFMTACASSPDAEHSQAGKRWAIAIHGGAGFIPRDISDDERAAYEHSLRAALKLGVDRLEAGEPALTVVEAVVRQLEDDPLYNAGRGGVFAEDGLVRHDASIMDGRDRSCGAVTGTTTVKHPITLARHVMTDTRHVFLSCAGAEAFADVAGVERVDNAYFHTNDRREDLRRALERRARRTEEAQREGGSTVGCVALDENGDLAAATSTGGLTAKRWGRIGDSPVIGAGTWADNATCALSSTGAGEQYIRNAIAHEIHALMLHRGWSLERAANHAIFEILKEGDGGVIGVSRTGELAMPFNTGSMTRGAADSSGRFDVGIWQD
jgi:L-asparaginase / beta-aspartyl-peptidase